MQRNSHDIAMIDEAKSLSRTCNGSHYPFDTYRLSWEFENRENNIPLDSHKFVWNNETIWHDQCDTFMPEVSGFIIDI